ncbi:nucleotidyltransferase family protein [Brevundimonas diminuta]|uniref:nucleotidyltransferase family protein n=1 Tax=Brevundimonas diminuta TaxID=293 RepID=UPI0022B0424B|nr:nucleotidyltransferase family protein [Brevundimonas diminuta]MCZ4108738.1 nucleotidyltransferase family protein [Brevundimonas diminuta]
MTLEARLTEIVRADAGLMHILTVMRELNLPDWRLFSGAVYQAVWNAQTGRPVGYGIKDYDIGYFDADTSWDAEDAVIKRVVAAFEPPLRDQVEVRNQARVHLWHPAKFGGSYSALTNTDEALTRFVAPCFAVGVRLEEDGEITVAAPFGLEDVFNLTIRPTPDRPVAKDWDRIIEKAKARWPELNVVQV